MTSEGRVSGDSPSPPPIARKLTLPNNPNVSARTYEDSSSEDEHVRVSRRERSSRRYYDSDASSDSFSSLEEKSGYSSPAFRRRIRHPDVVIDRRNAVSRKEKSALGYPDTTSVYPFSLPGHYRQQSFTEVGSSNGSERRDEWDDEDSENPGSGGQSANSWPRTIKNVHHVYHSRYTGEQVLYGGFQSAELTTSLYGGGDSQKPLFQWIHFQDNDMNFEVFQDRVQQIQNLSQSQKTAISKLLRKVKNKYDSPLQVANRPTIRIMQPGFDTEVELPVDEPTMMQQNSTFKKVVAWVCFPYFTLEQYQGLFSNPKKGAHPMHTLLQTRSTLIGEKREMRQAVCQLSDNQDNLCFHVGQLWCLVVDDSFLVTCGRMSFSTLQGEGVSLKTSPVPEPGLSESPRILVTCGPSVLWMFRVEECPTWFSFYSRFWQFSPRPVEFLYRGRVLNEATWPRILEYAALSERRKKGPLRLSFRLASRRSKDRLNFMSISRNQLEKPGTSVTVETLQIHEGGFPAFTIFTHLNSDKKSASPSSIDKQQLSKDLAQMHDFLKHDIEPHERIAYRECPDSSRQEVYSELRTQIRREQEFQSSQNSIRTETERSLVEFKKDLVGACEFIFGFFFPLNLTGPSISKFWGAVHRIVSADIPYDSDARTSRPRIIRVGRTRSMGLEDNNWEIELETLLKCLRSMAKKVKPFQQLVMMASPTDRTKIQIPEALPNAWIHLVMSLVLYMVPGLGHWESKADTAADLLNKGVTEMRKCFLALNSLIEDTVFTPCDLATLLVYQLAKDVTDSRLDIVETYQHQYVLLDNEVRTKPLDRSHQASIQLFEEELIAVTDTINKQQRVFAGIKAFCNKNPGSRRDEVYTKVYEDMKELEIMEEDSDIPRYSADNSLFDEFFKQSRPSSKQPGGYRQFLANDCLSILDSRRRRAMDMRDDGLKLAQFNVDQIETNRNRQDSAIYVFTVVTVIFLPLSTVATILGMNTNDVRNMEVNQWVFWAVAVPLTVIIALIGLVSTGELHNFMANLVGMWVQRKIIPGITGGLLYSMKEEDSVYDDSPPRRRRKVKVY